MAPFGNFDGLFTQFTQNSAPKCKKGQRGKFTIFHTNFPVTIKGIFALYLEMGFKFPLDPGCGTFFILPLILRYFESILMTTISTASPSSSSQFKSHCCSWIYLKDDVRLFSHSPIESPLDLLSRGIIEWIERGSWRLYNPRDAIILPEL